HNFEYRVDYSAGPTHGRWKPVANWYGTGNNVRRRIAGRDYLFSLGDGKRIEVRLLSTSGMRLCAALIADGFKTWADRDGDGVIDRLDNCPDWAGKPEFHGCNGPQLVKITDTKLELLETILFATNRTNINKKSNKVLDAAALVIKNHPEMRIEIEGHTDDRGSDASNLKLSDGRAAAVRKYFVKKGVPAARLTSKGYGEAQPIAENKTDAGRGKNRRVEFLILRDIETTVPAPTTVPATPAPAPKK
ncbi:MAG: OmpA family protein, partial [Deltaproteobacteria bacterium]|nr:OmpA family protein [Deltaproteobacteria bacterium]